VVAVLLWKALMVFLLPLVGIAAGFLFLVVKVFFWVVMVCVAIWILRRLARREEKLA
jgi:type IV secretory pathway VirB3-like protein